MVKVMFVCLGNICRSPMAEMIFKDLVAKRGLEDEFIINSSATSYEEIGNPIYPPAVRKLKEKGIQIHPHYATRLQQTDYQKYDYILGMEQRNVVNIKRIVGEDKENKVYRLTDFTKNPRDVADPWYTGDFEITYNDVLDGCECFLEYLLKTKRIK